MTDMKKNHNSARLVLFILMLILLTIIVVSLPSCYSYRPMSCPPDPMYKGRVKQKLPEPHFPFTKKPFES